MPKRIKNGVLKIIAFSGLGADHRVFRELDLNFPLEVIEWEDGFAGLSITAYAKLLRSKIPQNEKVCLMGVSFGGLIAQEVAQFIPVEKIILISSLESSTALNWFIRLVGKTGILNLFPPSFFKPPKRVAKYLFGAKNTKLLYKIIDDTDMKFAKWATQNLVNWKGVTRKVPTTRIHGSLDRLIAFPKSKDIVEIKGGGHFMIVDNAEELSSKINALLSPYV